MGIITWGFDIIPNFPNFLRKSFVRSLDRSAFREGTCIYHVYYNNQASFHLWWKEKLVKPQKFSKYYDHSCRFATKSSIIDVWQCPRRNFFKKKLDKVVVKVDVK